MSNDIRTPLIKSYRDIEHSLDNITTYRIGSDYIWYSIGEIILNSLPEVNTDHGYDLCGSMLSVITGSNSRCHDIINDIRDYRKDYEDILNLMQVSGDIQEVGEAWKKILISGDLESIIDMTDTLKLFRTKFLPAVKKYIEFWYESYHKNYNTSPLDKIIKIKSNRIKQFTDIVDGYIQVMICLSPRV